jgi:hypothetical protein
MQVGHAYHFEELQQRKIAVFRAANSGDAASILGPVREAQVALDAMEQPLKGCYDAMQNTQAEQQRGQQEIVEFITTHLTSKPFDGLWSG